MTERSIFLEAAEIADPAERAAYLDRACNGDAALRRGVEALLSVYDRSGSFMRHPAGGDATADHQPIEGPGTRVGPYKLLQEIGEGGMGTVFMAEQEEPVRRMVAVKIIRGGMDSRGVLARFEAERQALALMDHPNIAKVLDAGTTAGGSPYFVMELVKGVPITRFCDDNQLTLRDRLELFVPVCQAIQHAHQKGIIHRDVKPSNVLVALYDDRPVPKVIDFGVAKATSQRLTEKTLFTAFGAVVGTLEYMSPEQAKLNQLDIDTRSDVYALGVLLYELLTGSTPLDRARLKSAALDEVLRLIREEEPPRPSTRLSTAATLPEIAAARRTEPTQLGRVLRGELDWVVMKALEKDRTRRYETANGLARDVQRYLADQPVEARSASVGYRLRKFVRRNRGPVVAAGVVVGVLCLGLAGTVAGLVHARHEAVRATQAEEAALADREVMDRARLAEAAQRRIADDEKQTAQRERDAANAARLESRRTAYVMALNLIRSAWDENNVRLVRELLDVQRPKPGEEDLRHFEWHYWDRLCNAEVRSDTTPESSPIYLSFSGDGSRFLAVGSRSKFQARVVDSASMKTVQSWDVGKPAAGGAEGHFNRDGTRLAFGTRARGEVSPRITVWDVATGREVFAADGQFNPSWCLSPDGNRLATVEGGRGFRGATPDRPRPVTKVWDATDATRKPTVVADPDGDAVRNLLFSPDGTRLAAVLTRPDQNGKATVQIWDAVTGKTLSKTSVEDTSLHIAFGPDGRRLAGVGGVAGGDADRASQKTYLWSGADGDALKLERTTPLERPTSRGDTAGVVAFSPDARRLAMGSSSAVRILDADTGRELQLIKPGLVSHFLPHFNADGTRLYAAGMAFRNGSVSGTTVMEWVVPSAARSPDPKAARSRDGGLQASFQPKPGTPTEITIRDRTGRELLTFREHTGTVTDVTFNPDGSLVHSTQRNGAIIWEPRTGKVRWRSRSRDADGKGWLQCFLSKGGRFLVEVDDAGSRVVGFTDLKPMFDLGKPAAVSFSPDDRRLVTMHPRDGQLPGKNSAPGSVGAPKLWDVESGKEIPWGSKGPGNVTDVDFSRDGRLVATMHTMRAAVWDAATGARVRDLEIRGYSEASFSPDAGQLVTWTGNRVSEAPGMSVWEVATGRVVHRFEGIGQVRKAVFSPDGKRIASFVKAAGALGFEVKLWDAVTGRELLCFREKSSAPVAAQMLALSFSPDGHRLVLQCGPPDQPPWAWDATPRGVPGKP